MTRVLVHAGFHKTGTTSLQRYLSTHRDVLKPYFDYYDQTDLKAVVGLARIYGQRPFRWRKRHFQRAFDQFLATIPSAETIVISNETFSGQFPGHRNWRGKPIQTFRRAALPLCRAVAEALTRRFGRRVEISFLFTTRDSDPWLRPAYGHLVRSIDLAVELEDFRSQFRYQPDLMAEAATLTRALHPAPVHTVALEDVATRRAGPAAAVLDLVGVPEAIEPSLPPAARLNLRQSQELEDKFLKLNRSGLDAHRVKHEKQRLIQRAGL